MIRVCPNSYQFFSICYESISLFVYSLDFGMVLLLDHNDKNNSVL